MKQLLNTLFVTSEDIYLSLDGENVVANRSGTAVARYPLHTLQLEAGGVLSKLLLVSIFPDLALIFVFYTTDTWRLSKGVLIGAMPYILGALMVSM